MAMCRKILAAMLLAGSALTCLPAAPAGGNQKLNLDQQLQLAYPPTRLAGDKLRIVQPGSVLLVRINGMFASPLNEFAFANNFKDGRIKRSAASTLIHDGKTSRELQAGEKVYLLKTEVKDSGIVFSVQSCIACDGSAIDQVQMAYRASLNFQFPKGFAETADFVKIRQTIDQVFGFAFGDPGANPQPVMEAPPPPTAPPAPQTRPAPQAPPARIALGQTIDEVTANLGQPEKVVDLGSKKIYFYRDLKITFIEGKVSDVQ
jgi:hypothetical protein